MPAKIRSLKATDEEWNRIKARAKSQGKSATQYLLDLVAADIENFPRNPARPGAPEGNLNSVESFVINDETEGWIAADVVNTIVQRDGYENSPDGYEWDAWDFVNFDVINHPGIPDHTRRPVLEAVKSYRENKSQ